jgi:hypothetical protein
MELKNIISKIENVEDDILDYILKTEHYIFNWIENKEVQNFIQEYPDEYEDMIYLRVINVSISPTIRIYFTDHPNDVEYIERYTFLPTFKDTTKAKWLEWKGNLKEKQILEKEVEIEYFKKKLEDSEKELEELKRNFE